MISMQSTAGVIAEAPRFQHYAMACDWQVLMRGAPPDYAASAAQAAFDEVQRLEQEFSRFIPSSEISQLNAARAGEWVALSPDAFDCLSLAQRLWRSTHAAFDVTVGAWLERRARQSAVASTPTEVAPLPLGMQFLEICPQSRKIGKRVEGLRIDLGAVGKGFAVDRVAAVLREWRIPAALISAGQSSVYGYDLAGAGWVVGLRDPLEPQRTLGFICLNATSLSGSGRARLGDHILDPRVARPATSRVAAWAHGASAAVTDAASTGCMAMTMEEISELCAVESLGALLIGSPGEKFVAVGVLPASLEQRS